LDESRSRLFRSISISNDMVGTDEGAALEKSAQRKVRR
jgi:hypothetical protein